MGLYKFLPLYPPTHFQAQSYVLTAHLPGLSYYDDTHNCILPLAENSAPLPNVTLYRIFEHPPVLVQTVPSFIPFFDTLDTKLSALYHQQLWRLNNPAGLILAYGLFANSFPVYGPNAPPEHKLMTEIQIKLFDLGRSNGVELPMSSVAQQEILEEPVQAVEQQNEAADELLEAPGLLKGVTAVDGDEPCEDEESDEELERLAHHRVAEISDWVTHVTPGEDEAPPDVIDDERYSKLETLAPIPTHSPSLPCEEPFVADSSASDRIWLKTGRREKVPWYMGIKRPGNEDGYDMLAGPLPMSQPFNEFRPPRASRPLPRPFSEMITLRLSLNVSRKTTFPIT